MMPDPAEVAVAGTTTTIRQRLSKVDETRGSSRSVAAAPSAAFQCGVLAIPAREARENRCRPSAKRASVPLAPHGDIWSSATATGPLKLPANRSASILVATDVAARGLDDGGADAVRSTTESPATSRCMRIASGKIDVPAARACILHAGRREEALSASQAEFRRASNRRRLPPRDVLEVVSPSNRTS
ncbi:hypothetical protein DSL92_04075 [Billgrantia gudaonensis]|uniref:Uncharacterized protein n=1 Tax=Billgrantia gudaonensis TaxID=376427 RepID=A0A432JKG0_9GAMM|nr:hypothetical protein DSL92_04075 [Halomonas gudaonensis]